MKYYNSDGTTQILNGTTNGTDVFKDKVIKSGENTSAFSNICRVTCLSENKDCFFLISGLTIFKYQYPNFNNMAYKLI
ncbi:MAG: hypothetical protein ORN85_07960 [Sediminibacterium sp.]|nr:hypothetical protein [Sediminibacterium sp.]